LTAGSPRHVPASLERRVRERATNCCEYCGIAQAGQEATFHIDLVLPRTAGGPTTYENLALASVSRSLCKGARTEARDPETDETVPLYSPRGAQTKWSGRVDSNHRPLDPQSSGPSDSKHLSHPTQPS